MVGSLLAGVSGIQQFQQKLDVIGNNISNSNTLGFKSGRADFEDTFSQSLSGGSSEIQIGSGVQTGTVRSLFTQGVLASTGRPEDLGISGNGFFTVKDPVSGNTFATRAGNFTKDNDGYLITTDGFRLQGYDGAGTTPGDIKIDPTGNPAGATDLEVKRFSVGDDGKITVVLSDDSSFTRGQVLLQNYQNPNALIKEGNNLFSGLAAAGPLAAPAAPKSSGLGSISGGHLETSNVDIAAEFAEMITTQRGFQASARIITTTDEMLQEVVNLKH